jgi:hypothetical protein
MIFWESSGIWPVRKELGEFLTNYDGIRHVGGKWNFKTICWESSGIRPVRFYT